MCKHFQNVFSFQSYNKNISDSRKQDGKMKPVVNKYVCIWHEGGEGWPRISRRRKKRKLEWWFLLSACILGSFNSICHDPINATLFQHYIKKIIQAILLPYPDQMITLSITITSIVILNVNTILTSTVSQSAIWLAVILTIRQYRIYALEKVA
jgi:hypothetical protein